MKPTLEQVQKYIQYADAELGPECVEPWVEWCRKALLDSWFQGMSTWPEDVVACRSQEGGKGGTSDPFVHKGKSSGFMQGGKGGTGDSPVVPFEIKYL